MFWIIISGIAAEIIPKSRGPKNNSRACLVLSPSLLHAHVAHICVNFQHLNRETKAGQLSQFQTMLAVFEPVLAGFLSQF